MKNRNLGLYAILFALAGCNAPDFGEVLGSDQVSGPIAPVPHEPVPVPTGYDSGNGPIIGDSCRTTDSSKVCLGLKYVVFKDSAGNPVVSQEEAIANVKAMNAIYGRCNIAFQIEHYIPVDPASFKLRYRIANYGELDDIRETFIDDETLLVVTTGPWDRTGSLGNTGANAWTAMPGGGPYGAVLESTVGTYSNIIAHEVGHYLNLDHVSDKADLMSPIIYSNSTALTAGQCSTMRTAASYYWPRMYR